MQRIFSFSVPEDDTEAYEAIKQLKLKSKKTGVSFSFLMLELIKERYCED